MISLRKQRGIKQNRNSLIVSGTLIIQGYCKINFFNILGNTSTNALIQFVLNSGCFRNKDIGSLNTKDTFSIYNYICTLLAYSLNQLTRADLPIIVLIDSARIPVKALRLFLKACQNVLAFRSKHVLIGKSHYFYKISLSFLSTTG